VISYLYCHGFASSPQSVKAQAFVAWGKARGIEIEPLDLRVPSFEGLLFSEILATVRRAIDARGGAGARVVLIGSSLGGLTACRVAEADPRVGAVFAMAPAFRLADLWKSRPESERRVHARFIEELDALDIGLPDVRVPTCIVHGTNDEVVPVEGSRRWAAGKEHVRLVEVEDSHELLASVPRILAEAGHFLESVRIS